MALGARTGGVWAVAAPLATLAISCAIVAAAALVFTYFGVQNAEMEKKAYFVIGVCMLAHLWRTH